MPSSNHPAATAAPLPTDISAPPVTSRRHWLKSLGGASVAGVLGSQLVACGGGSGSSGGFLPFASAAPPPVPPSDTPTLPAKALFPGVADRVYLNGAADHPWNQYATDALSSYAQSKLSLASGSATATAKFAALINADADEIAYVPSTSMGEYLVTRALGLPESGGRVVTDALHFVGSFYMYEQYRCAASTCSRCRWTPTTASRWPTSTRPSRRAPGWWRSRTCRSTTASRTTSRPCVISRTRAARWSTST